jgi:hypothetical protein
LIVRVGTLSYFHQDIIYLTSFFHLPFLSKLCQGALGKHDRPMMTQVLSVQSTQDMCHILMFMSFLCQIKVRVQMSLTSERWLCWSGFCVLPTFLLGIRSWLKHIKHNESNLSYLATIFHCGGSRDFGQRWWKMIIIPLHRKYYCIWSRSNIVSIEPPNSSYM